MATSGLAAQSFGANNPQMYFLVLLRSLAISLALAALLLLLGHPLFEGALWIIHPTPETSQLSSIYFHILLFGAPAMLCQMSLTGWFVGMQDTRSTLVVALVQNVVNIIASSLLVFGIGLKVEGVALGTLIAQWTAAGTGYLIFRKRYAHIRSNIPLALVLSKRGFSRLLRVSRDLFFRTLCLVSVMLFLTVAGSWMGDTTLAANTLLMQFYLLLSYIMDGFAYAYVSDEGSVLFIDTRKVDKEVAEELSKSNVKIADYNGDGVIDTNDSAPYGFTGTPQNTYNATIGIKCHAHS